MRPPPPPLFAAARALFTARVVTWQSPTSSADPDLARRTRVRRIARRARRFRLHANSPRRPRNPSSSTRYLYFVTWAGFAKRLGAAVGAHARNPDRPRAARHDDAFPAGLFELPIRWLASECAYFSRCLEFPDEWRVVARDRAEALHGRARVPRLRQPERAARARVPLHCAICGARAAAQPNYARRRAAPRAWRLARPIAAGLPAAAVGARARAARGARRGRAAAPALRRPAAADAQHVGARRQPPAHRLGRALRAPRVACAWRRRRRRPRGERRRRGTSDGAPRRLPRAAFLPSRRSRSAARRRART